MQARERRKQLRGLIVQRDGESLVELLRLEALPGDALQLIGDGLSKEELDRRLDVLAMTNVERDS